MFRKREDHYFIEEFEALGVEALYTTSDFDFDKFQWGKKVVHVYQTHSKNIEIFEENIDFKSLPIHGRDGILTSRKDLVLYTKHADCLALYFFDRKKEIIGVCHSGWRGSFDAIALEMLSAMRKEYGSQLEDILIGIGIGISQKNYEVSSEFFGDFKERYGDKVLSEVFKEEEGKIFFDNEKFNFNLLMDYGMKRENIICSGLCTFKDEKLHSYRRDREKSGRNRAYIYYGMG